MAVTGGCLGNTDDRADATALFPEECNGYDDDGDGLIDEVPCPERYSCFRVVGS